MKLRLVWLLWLGVLSAALAQPAAEAGVALCRLHGHEPKGFRGWVARLEEDLLELAVTAHRLTSDEPAVRRRGVCQQLNGDLGEPGAHVVVNGEDATERVRLALELTEARGTADSVDRELVVRELAKLPLRMLERLQVGGTTVVVCRGSVTEVLGFLKYFRPRGYPPGWRWSSVPGTFFPMTNQVVVATRGHDSGQGPYLPRGGFNMVLHEVGHAIDKPRLWSRRRSNARAFREARELDFDELSSYEQQKGAAGRQETYAEVFTMFYGGHPGLERRHPALHAYFEGE